MTAEVLAARLKAGQYNYNGEKVIRLWSCSTAGSTDDGSKSFAAKLSALMNVTVVAPTTDVQITRFAGTTTTKLVPRINKKFSRSNDKGIWVKCISGACRPYLDSDGRPLD